jgi:hypothetical protein
MIKKHNYRMSRQIHRNITTIPSLFSVILILTGGGIGLSLLQQQQQEAHASLQQGQDLALEKYPRCCVAFNGAADRQIMCYALPEGLVQACTGSGFRRKSAAQPCACQFMTAVLFALLLSVTVSLNLRLVFLFIFCTGVIIYRVFHFVENIFGS